MNSYTTVDSLPEWGVVLRRADVTRPSEKQLAKYVSECLNQSRYDFGLSYRSGRLKRQVGEKQRNESFIPRQIMLIFIDYVQSNSGDSEMLVYAYTLDAQPLLGSTTDIREITSSAKLLGTFSYSEISRLKETDEDELQIMQEVLLIKSPEE